MHHMQLAPSPSQPCAGRALLRCAEQRGDGFQLILTRQSSMHAYYMLQDYSRLSINYIAPLQGAGHGRSCSAALPEGRRQHRRPYRG